MQTTWYACAKNAHGQLQFTFRGHGRQPFVHWGSKKYSVSIYTLVLLRVYLCIYIRYLDYTFFAPGDPNWRNTVPTNEAWDDMKFNCFTMSPGDACGHSTSLIHAGQGNQSSDPKYSLFLAWPTEYISARTDTDEVVVFYESWMDLTSDI